MVSLENKIKIASEEFFTTFDLLYQGHGKLFVTSQAKLNLSTIQLNAWATDTIVIGEHHLQR